MSPLSIAWAMERDRFEHAKRSFFPIVEKHWPRGAAAVGGQYLAAERCFSAAPPRPAEGKGRVIRSNHDSAPLALRMPALDRGASTLPVHSVHCQVRYCGPAHAPGLPLPRHSDVPGSGRYLPHRSGSAGEWSPSNPVETQSLLQPARRNGERSRQALSCESHGARLDGRARLDPRVSPKFYVTFCPPMRYTW